MIERHIQNPEKYKNIPKEKILKQAKSLMDSFIKEMEKIDEIKEFFIERDESLRQATPKESNQEFHKLFLENAPAVKRNQIQAEKGKWKK